MNKQRDSRAPKGFLNVNELKDKEVLPLRVIGSIEPCRRCYNLVAIKSILDTVLTTYVCKDCRMDSQEWDYMKHGDGMSYTVKAMVNEQPDKYYTDHQSGEGRS